MSGKTQAYQGTSPNTYVTTATAYTGKNGGLPMGQKLAVAVIHGIGRQQPNFAEDIEAILVKQYKKK
ncbi:hypothetical protein J31TS4_21180 [Paenibacillus sp. J31TS4]|nr:hypothetical protein J31TS4_21180 [Paenibacillus sp. J31TS4]